MKLIWLLGIAVSCLLVHSGGHVLLNKELICLENHEYLIVDQEDLGLIRPLQKVSDDFFPCNSVNVNKNPPELNNH
jgi:hypothetical protein